MYNRGDAVFLRSIADTLERWIFETETGGWSTHQVPGMKRLAENIYAELGKGGVGVNTEEMLRDAASQMDRWIAQSATDGWSTHLTESQERTSKQIYAYLGRNYGP